MADRPRREPKPTKRFDPIAFSSTTRVGSSTKKKKIVKIEGDVTVDKNFRGKLVLGGRSHRNRDTTVKQSESRSDEPFGDILSDQTTIDVVDANDVIGSDTEYCESSSDLDHFSPQRITHGPVARLSKPRSPDGTETLQQIEDQVIEQWYADPYERVDPEQPAYDEWRRRQLQSRVFEQGWLLCFIRSNLG